MSVKTGSFTIDNAQKLSHAYIVASTDRQQALALAEDIAAAAVCRGSGSLPCGECRACKKVYSRNHQDVIYVEREENDSGTKKRDLTVNVLRAVVGSAHLIPEEAPRKAYIFTEAELMNISAQNAALKLLEEPPRHCILILCALSAEMLLPTVRSRCTELVVNPPLRVDGSECFENARRYLELVAKGKSAELWAFCFETGKSFKVPDTMEFVSCINECIADTMCGRLDNPGLSLEKLLSLRELMVRCGEYLSCNVGPKHILGLLSTAILEED